MECGSRHALFPSFLTMLPDSTYRSLQNRRPCKKLLVTPFLTAKTRPIYLHYNLPRPGLSSPTLTSSLSVFLLFSTGTDMRSMPSVVEVDGTVPVTTRVKTVVNVCSWPSSGFRGETMKSQEVKGELAVFSMVPWPDSCVHEPK